MSTRLSALRDKYNITAQSAKSLTDTYNALTDVHNSVSANLCFYIVDDLALLCLEMLSENSPEYAKLSAARTRALAQWR